MSVNAPETEAPTPQQRGFLIRDVQYPYPYPFKLTDCLLVVELCGCRWEDFESRVLGEDDPEDPDDAEVAQPSWVSKEQLFAGLVACAIAHANPHWPQRKVITYVRGIDEPEVGMYGFDDEIAAMDADPPAEAPTTEPTTTGTAPETDAQESPDPQE